MSIKHNYKLAEVILKFKKYFTELKKTLHLQTLNGTGYHSSVGRAKD